MANRNEIMDEIKNEQLHRERRSAEDRHINRDYLVEYFGDDVCLGNDFTYGDERAENYADDKRANRYENSPTVCPAKRGGGVGYKGEIKLHKPLKKSGQAEELRLVLLVVC